MIFSQEYRNFPHSCTILGILTLRNWLRSMCPDTLHSHFSGRGLQTVVAPPWSAFAWGWLKNGILSFCLINLIRSRSYCLPSNSSLSSLMTEVSWVVPSDFTMSFPNLFTMSWVMKYFHFFLNVKLVKFKIQYFPFSLLGHFFCEAGRKRDQLIRGSVKTYKKIWWDLNKSINMNY